MPQNTRLSAVQRKWLESLQTRDPELFAALKETVPAPEAVGAVSDALGDAGPQGLPDFVVETIVRKGRPALTIKDDLIVAAGPEIEASAQPIAKRLIDAATILNPILPLIGRIDVANHPSNFPYVGTGWLIEPDVVVTNRHVAELIARADANHFRFRLDGFGHPLSVSVDYYHERDTSNRAVAQVQRVIYIERDPSQADIAFIQVGPRSDGRASGKIVLAASDPSDATAVAVIGFPARASSDVVPDQARMDQIYGGRYDVKRIAPGLIGPSSSGWMTHDCTTLGGNSGSVVLDMKTGEAVGLHFAGLYLIENYAVPVSTIRDYLRRRPWHGERPGGGVTPPPTPSNPGQAPPSGSDQMTFTLSVPVTVSIGKAAITVGAAQVDGGGAGGPSGDIEAAAGRLSQRVVSGVLAVRPGYVVAQGRLTDNDCLVVSASPQQVPDVRGAMPSTFEGFPVEVRPASILDQAAAAFPGFDEAAVTSIAYDDNARTGAGFSFSFIDDEEMELLLHVGPERSWKELEEFITDETAAPEARELVVSMYEFHASHIAGAFDAPVAADVPLHMVLATQSRNPTSGEFDEGEFDRMKRFNKWEKDLTTFDRVFVPLGANGLVASSYHIKVTVRDRSTVWLSSGNWKSSSQPEIANADLNNPKKTSTAGNREWHVVVKSKKLAERFRNHILQDLKRSQDLGGTTEAIGQQVLVDVPIALLETAQLEAPAKEVLQAMAIPRRKVKVKPLLTPDKKGKVYSDAVLELIESAKTQLLFQIPYIYGTVKTGLLGGLIDALIRKSKEIDDFRLILRSDGLKIDDVSALKRRGLDVANLVRKLPKTHTKGMVVDGNRVLVGSHNWSGQGVTLNRDASLLFHDEVVAQYYRRAFEIDWDRASEIFLESAINESVSGGQVRLATGATPPPGFRRMTLDDYLEG